MTDEEDATREPLGRTMKTPTDLGGLEQPEPAGYDSLAEVPFERRMLSGAMLDVDQANWIDERAHELGVWVVDEDGTALHFVPFWGHARREFIQSHEIVGGIWHAKTAEADA